MVVEEKEMMKGQVELEENRKALKVKELEQKIEEQRVVIEQQQETLDESVKTILKLYSLNNGQGDDMSTMSEEQLTGIARAMVPRASGRQTLPTVRDDAPSTPSGGGSHLGGGSSRGGSSALSGSFDRRRDATTSGRGRAAQALTDDVETLMLESESRVRARSRGRARQEMEETDIIDRPVVARARSRGRPAYQTEELADMRVRARSKSRGRAESLRQLTERARTPGRVRSRSPGRHRGDNRDYDPSGPESDSRALVLSTPAAADSGRKYGGQYDIPQSSSGPRQNSRRDVGGGKYDNYDGPTRHDAPRSGGHPDRHERHGHQQQRRSYHEDGYRGSNNPRRGADRGGDRDGGDRRRSGGGGDHYRRRGSHGEYSGARSYRSKNYKHNDEHYTPRRVPREPSVLDVSEGPRVMADGDDGRAWSGSSNRRRSSRRHHSRDRDPDY